MVSSLSQCFESQKTIITEINQQIGAAGIVSQECKTVVAEYGEQILDLLLSETQPLKICSQIGLCTFVGTQGVGIGIESVVNGDKSVGSDAMCSVCEMTVVWMQNQLKQNKTQELILNYINQVRESEEKVNALISKEREILLKQRDFAL